MAQDSNDLMASIRKSVREQISNNIQFDDVLETIITEEVQELKEEKLAPLIRQEVQRYCYKKTAEYVSDILDKDGPLEEDMKGFVERCMESFGRGFMQSILSQSLSSFGMAMNQSLKEALEVRPCHSMDCNGVAMVGQNCPHCGSMV